MVKDLGQCFQAWQRQVDLTASKQKYILINSVSALFKAHVQLIDDTKSIKPWPVQALAGSAQSTSEVAQCCCAFMHILNVKRQLIEEIIFQMTDHLITRAANRKQKKKQLRKSAI